VSAQPFGYREIEHTADWELEIWAPDLTTLLEQAAHGMYTLAGIQLHPTPRIIRQLELTASDHESLLVKFLTELLFQGEQYGLGYDIFDLQVSENILRGKMSGAPIAGQTKEIKAVTYHYLAIRQTERGLEARVVFDV
jgi:SHS2 domain-containing protein